MKQSSFKKDVLTLFSGSGASALLGLLVIPILTRLFNPEAFGLAAVFTSTVGIVCTLSSLRYEITIVIPKTDAEASNMLALSIFCSIVTTVLLSVFITIFGPALSKILNQPEILNIMWLIPIYSFLNGTYNAFNYWETRHKNFQNISNSHISHQVSSCATSLSAGISNHNNGEYLVYATLVGKTVSTIHLIKNTAKTHGKEILNNINWKGMLSGAIRYKDFPLYGSWSILLGVAAWQLPVLLLGVFFTPAMVGAYALGFKVLQTPIQLVSSSIGQVFFQKAVHAKIHNTLGTHVENLVDKLIAYAMLPTLILLAIGQDCFVFVFGKSWQEAGLYVQILSCWCFIWFLSNPLTSLFTVMEEQALQLKWNIFNFSLRLLAITIGGVMQSPLWAISLLSITGFFIYGVKIILTLKICKGSIAKVSKSLVYHFIISLPFIALIATLKLYQVDTILLIAAALTANLIYYAGLGILNNKQTMV